MTNCTDSPGFPGEHVWLKKLRDRLPATLHQPQQVLDLANMKNGDYAICSPYTRHSECCCSSAIIICIQYGKFLLQLGKLAVLEYIKSSFFNFKWWVASKHSLLKLVFSKYMSQDNLMTWQQGITKTETNQLKTFLNTCKQTMPLIIYL